MHDHLPVVCFIVCDSGPAIHFAEFAKNLIVEDQLRIVIYASGSAQAKLQEFHFPDSIDLFHFMLDGLSSEEEQNLANEILENCVTQGVQTIIVDIANKFDIKLQEAFNKLDVTLLNIRFWCYYDNSEQYVPGGYSIRSGEMIKLSQNILFANMNLNKRNSNIFSLPNVRINLNSKNIQGIGYYPIEIAERLEKRREIEQEILREKYGWNNIKYIFVYFGGNNNAYYEQAFPNFLSSLSQIDKKLFEDIIFLIHQHPVAKIQNHDGHLFQKWLLNNHHIRAILSQLTSDEAQIIANGILYYQTSMAPQFALIGLPIIQVGHEIYEDILVRNNLCETATNSIELINGLEILKKKNQLSNSLQQKQLIYDAIGYNPNWLNNLRNVILDV
jgi:hypothetical protein